MARMSLEDFSAQLSNALGARLGTLLLYGSAARAGGGATPSTPGMNTLLVVAGDGAADAALFSAIAEPVRAWVAAGHPPPLILTEREWRESADAFPIEYEDIREAHRVLAGRDPLAGIAVSRDHVRRQLEHELKGKLMHLRQAYAAAWDRPKQLAEIVRETRPGFLAMLRAALRLAGRTPPAEPEVLVRAAGTLIGFAPEALTEPAAYLSAVTRTADYVNRLERTFS